MKVPKMYKSSDRYDAGTDVIYDDDSKLQYAPFIYATTKSGDSDDGGDDGGDEEGEDSMVINESSGVLDKHASEILENMKAGKTCIVVNNSDNSESLYEYVTYAYVSQSNAKVDVKLSNKNCVRTITGDFAGNATEKNYEETDGGFPTLVEG